MLSAASILRNDQYLASNLTNDEYNSLLAEIVSEDHGATAGIFDVPGVYEALAAHYQQEMVRRVIARIG